MTPLSMVSLNGKNEYSSDNNIHEVRGHPFSTYALRGRGGGGGGG